MVSTAWSLCLKIFDDSVINVYFIQNALGSVFTCRADHFSNLQQLTKWWQHTYRDIPSAWKRLGRAKVNFPNVDFVNRCFRFQVINREPVLLRGEIVKSVQVVDPLETFGLFSVQNFAVTEFCEDCQVLKVSLHLVISEALGPHGLCGAPLRIERAGFKPWPRHCVLFSQFLTPPRYVNGYRRN